MAEQKTKKELELEELNKQINKLKKEKEDAEKEINRIAYNLDGDLVSAVNSEKSKCLSGYNDAISKAKRKLSEAKSNKARARDKMIEEMVKKALAPHHENIKSIKERISKTVKDNNISPVAKLELYDRLWGNQAEGIPNIGKIIENIVLSIFGASCLCLVLAIFGVRIYVVHGIAIIIIITILYMSFWAYVYMTTRGKKAQIDEIISLHNNIKEEKTAIQNAEAETRKEAANTKFDLFFEEQAVDDAEKMLQSANEELNDAESKFNSDVKPVIIDRVKKETEQKISSLKNRIETITLDLRDLDMKKFIVETKYGSEG